MTDQLRDTIRGLFQENKVDLVIGWREGTLPGSATPAFIRDVKDVDSLIWDERCTHNLTVYLTKDKRHLAKSGEKIGIVVKGCDARSLVLYAIENQIRRENLVIIGVPCQGVIDSHKIEKVAEGAEVLSLELGDTVKISSQGFEKKVPKEEILSSSCLTCAHPHAPVYDIFIGEAEAGPREHKGDAVVDTFEQLPAEERWQAITEAYSKCLRCYACRNVCPSCYCTECFVDQNDPQWIGKTTEITDTLIFHLGRNIHVAGRCVECGACERACPADIDLLLLNRKIAREIRERFDFEAGLDINEKPALASFCENEKQDFIMG